MLRMEEAMVTRAWGFEEREKKSSGEKRKRLGTPSDLQVARKMDMLWDALWEHGEGREDGRRMFSRL